jgi:GT2 family glycosyltransferase
LIFTYHRGADTQNDNRFYFVMKTTKHISIIIPTCRRISDLERCLEELVPQLPTDESCELIITDDGKVSDTKKALESKFPVVSWIQGPRRGPAANRNHGAKISQGDWLIFLDDDIIPRKDYLAAIKFATHYYLEYDIFEGQILNERPVPSLLWEAPFNNEDLPQLTCSASFCIRASTFFQCGGFDERYGSGVYAEDVEFAARLLAIGVRKKFLPEASVIHPIRRRPGPWRLARRWEGMCIMGHDQGATWFRITWNLPWHALRVIQSRFRGKKWSTDNLKAALLFTGELLCVLVLAPRWAAKWSKTKRSSFWTSWVASHGPAAKYGF